MNIIEKTYKLNGDLRARSKTTRIILHHAAATKCTVEDIDRWHKDNGWTCIGYHFFVNKKGEIYRGRKENTVGAHAGDNNTDSIGVCAEGNFEKETMGTAQKEALKELVAYLKDKYKISKVQKHKDVNATACPGKNYPFNEIAKATTKKEEPKATTTTITTTTTTSYLVKVTANVLNIRAGAGTKYKVVGQIKDKGTYTIVETKNNWGKLKSGTGWICLDYTTKTTSKKSVAKKETKKSIEVIAKEVIAGKWGNGEDRKKNLEAAGYDYNAVQKKVNQLLK